MLAFDSSRRKSSREFKYKMMNRQSKINRIGLGIVVLMGIMMLYSVMKGVNQISHTGTSSSAFPSRFRGPVSDKDRNVDARPSSQVTVASAGPMGRMPASVDIAVVADLDKKSKVEDETGKVKFYSLFRRGQIHRKSDESYTVSWSDPEKFDTKMNEGGRGFELSALHWFDGRLYTVDDRTGIVFELHNFRGSGLGSKMYASARYIIMEGDGASDKGQKNEWVTVKDGKMYIGSIGKEYTDNDGNILGHSNLWVAVVDSNGHVEHQDWTEYYLRIRQALGCEYPSYVVHEAIEWSAEHRRWFLLPRRVSHEPYDDMRDEKKGSNHILVANEDFTDIDVRTVGSVTPERGFSSFKFMPSSKDTIIVALKSMENEKLQQQATYITVFDIDGKVLMDETEIPGDANKYEGIAMLNDWSPRQPHLDA